MAGSDPIENIKLDIRKGIMKAVGDTGDYVHEIMEFVTDSFYGEYTPREFKRQKKNGGIKGALTKDDIEPYGKNGFSMKVHFDIDKLAHERPTVYGLSGKKHRVDWTEEEILATVMEDHYVAGSHGGVRGGTKIWIDSMGLLEPTTRNELKKNLDIRLK